MKTGPASILGNMMFCEEKACYKHMLWLQLINFGQKIEKAQHVLDDCVCMCVCVCALQRFRNVGWQSGNVGPPTDPNTKSSAWCGLGSISNFWELISLQQEVGLCLICPKDIIKH